MGQHNSHFHLWKEIHKNVAHQLNKLQLVERRVGEIEHWIGGLSLQVGGVEVRVAKQEVVGNRLLRLVLWSVGGVLHLMAKVDFLHHLVTSFVSLGGVSSRYNLHPFFVIFDSLSSLFLLFILLHSSNLQSTTSHSFPFISPPLLQDIRTDCKTMKKIFD